jgi:hypothetical protein
VAFLRKRGISDEERRRLPLGRPLVRDFPVLHTGSVPYREAPPDWGRLGYSNTADPWKEERYAF